MNAQLEKLCREYAAEGGKWTRCFYTKREYEDANNWIAVLIEGANADAVQAANAAVIRRRFREGKNIRYEYINYGWINRSLADTYLMVRVRRKSGAFTEQFKRIVQILERLNVYPLLDEDLYYKINKQRLAEAIEDRLPNLSRKQRNKVLAYLEEQGVDADSQFLWSATKEALKELGINEYGEPVEN